MIGVSENSTINICNDVNKSIKNKRNKRAYKKIHMVDDLHWKTANYLAKNFNCILLGNMSTKSITRKTNKILSDLQKTACLRTRYFEFYQRLQFKCKQYKTSFKLVNECYTSKLCSICGNLKEDLGE